MNPRTRGSVHCMKQSLDYWKISFLQMHPLPSKLATQLPFVFDSPDLIYGNYHQACVVGKKRERTELRDRTRILESKIRETILRFQRRGDWSQTKKSSYSTLTEIDLFIW